MTRANKLHAVAITIIVLGIAAGGVSWAYEGTTGWVFTGLSLALVIAGIVVSRFAVREERRQNAESE